MLQDQADVGLEAGGLGGNMLGLARSPPSFGDAAGVGSVDVLE